MLRFNSENKVWRHKSSFKGSGEEDVSSYEDIGRWSGKKMRVYTIWRVQVLKNLKSSLNSEEASSEDCSC